MSAQDTGAAVVALSNLAAAVKPPAAVVAPAASEPDVEEDDLRDIFLEEAREVVQNGLTAIAALKANPGDASELTTLRRAFHTLKGSSRMVGLTEFGEAAWSLEQVLNTWLADQKTGQRGSVQPCRAMPCGLRSLDRRHRQPDRRRLEGRPCSAGRPMPCAPKAGWCPWSCRTARQPVEASATGRHSGCTSKQPAKPPTRFLRRRPSRPTSSSISPSDLDAANPAPEAVQPPDRIEGIDFGSLAAVSTSACGSRCSSGPTPPSHRSAVDELIIDMADFALPEPPLEEPASVPEPVVLDDFAFDLADPQPEPRGLWPRWHPEVAETIDTDEQVKVIGSLRIGIPLYNVYLNEADEWSRRLATEVTEWALELNQQVPDSTVGLAHALAGSSATVGFHALSEVARALENALEHTQTLAYGTVQHGTAFIEAAEEIRRLLHQFAAGFLKEPNAGVIDALQALKELAIPQRADLPEDER